MDITRPIRVTDRDRNPIVGSLNSFVANLITFAETKKPNGNKMKEINASERLQGEFAKSRKSRGKSRTSPSG